LAGTAAILAAFHVERAVEKREEASKLLSFSHGGARDFPHQNCFEDWLNELSGVVVAAQQLRSCLLAFDFPQSRRFALQPA
jgi:hypothetical protein